jgi:hypothetical protein
MVAHTCNPRYLGGRDQEDHGSRPAWAKIKQDSQKDKLGAVGGGQTMYTHMNK